MPRSKRKGQAGDCFTVGQTELVISARDGRNLKFLNSSGSESFQRSWEIFKESMELGGNASMDSNQSQEVEKGRGPQF